jgi:glycerol-3-phosphate cytidylyltransferase-like family protein
MFNIHNKLWEDALNSLLSVARKFYKENNIAHLQYILDDLSIETLNMSEDDLEESDLGIYVTDSIKENYVFEVLGQISQALIQNDKANFSHIISILEADSLGELKRQIRDFERQQKEEAAAQGQQQSQMQRESLEYQRETMMMREKEITEREITKAKIDVWKMQQDIDTNDNYIADFLETENFNLKVKESDRKNEIEREKLELKKKEVAIKKTIAEKPALKK